MKIKKKIWMIAVALTLFTVLFAIGASAETVSGTSGNMDWSLDTSTGELTISGSGEMTSAWNVADYNDSVTKIIVEEGVTALCKKAFNSLTQEFTISLPSTLEKIDGDFNNCTKLTSVTFAEDGSLKAIYAWSFSGCSALKEVKLPNNAETKVYNGAFNNCRKLTSVALGDKTTSILGNAFNNCSALTEIVIPAFVGTLGDATNGSAFNGCSALAKVTFLGMDIQIFPATASAIPANAVLHGFRNSTAESYANTYNRSFVELVTTIGGACGANLKWELSNDGELIISGTGAMNDYSSATAPWKDYNDRIVKVTVGEGVTALWSTNRSQPFNGLTQDFTISLPSTLTKIDRDFNGCANLTTVIFPKEGVLAKVDGWAFANCKKLVSITFPDNAETKFYDGSFNNCTSLVSVTLGNKTTQLNGRVFNNCTALTEIVIPDSVTQVGNSTAGQGSAFNGCSKLEKVIFLGTNTAILPADANGIPSNATIYGFKGSTAEIYANDYERIFVDLEGDANYIAYQTTILESKVVDGVTKECFNLRILSGINSLEYSKVGYQITVMYEQSGEIFEATKDISTNTVFEAVMQGDVWTPAHEYDAQYFLAIAIGDIDADCERIEFAIKPYAVKDGVKKYGDSTILTWTGDTDTEGYPILEYSTDSYTAIEEVPYKALGRTQMLDGSLVADWSAAGFEFEAICMGDVSIKATSTGTVRFTVIVDGTEYKDVKISNGENIIATDLIYGKHRFKIMNQDGYYAPVSFDGVTLCGTFEQAPAARELLIEFIGDSIMHGSGLGSADYSKGIQDGTLSYAYLAAKELGVDYTIMANGGMGVLWGTDYDTTDVNRSMEKYPYLNDTSRGNILYNGYEKPADLVVIGLNTNDNYRFELQYKADREAYKAENPGFTWDEVDAHSIEFTSRKMAELGEELKLLIAEIEKNHGENVPIVLARGMMEGDGSNELYLTSVNYMTSLIEDEWQGKYGDHIIKVVHLTSDRAGYANHPTREGAALQGAELAEFIRNEFPEFADLADSRKIISTYSESDEQFFSTTEIPVFIDDNAGLRLSSLNSKFVFSADCEGDVTLKVNAKAVSDTADTAVVKISVDGQSKTVSLAYLNQRLTVAENLDKGIHTFEIEKISGGDILRVDSVTLNGEIAEAPEVRTEDGIFVEVFAPKNAEHPYSSFNVYTQTTHPSGKYFIRYKFVYEYYDKDNSLTWSTGANTGANTSNYRIMTAQIVEKVGNKEFSDVYEILQGGEISLAIKEYDSVNKAMAGDFIGGYHGDENLTSVSLMLDGNQTIQLLNGAEGFYNCTTVDFKQQSVINRCHTPGEDVMNHIQHYLVDTNGIKLLQQVEWLVDDFTTSSGQTYLQMFTPYRTNPTNKSDYLTTLLNVLDEDGKAIFSNVDLTADEFNSGSSVDLDKSADARYAEYFGEEKGIYAKAGFQFVDNSCRLNNAFVSIRTNGDSKWYPSFGGVTPSAGDVWTINSIYYMDYNPAE